jgi:hypothetical protein
MRRLGTKFSSGRRDAKGKVVGTPAGIHLIVKFRAPQEEVPRLARFMGKPGTISPKARMYLLAGWFFPERFK